MDTKLINEIYDMKSVIGALMMQTEAVQKAIIELEKENACLTELAEHLATIQLKHHQRLLNLESTEKHT